MERGHSSFWRGIWEVGSDLLRRHSPEIESWLLSGLLTRCISSNRAVYSFRRESTACERSCPLVQQALQVLESQFMPESRNQVIDNQGANGDTRSISRRSFLAGSLAATASAGWIARSACGAAPLGLEVLGKVRSRPAASIAASPLGVGFETLDRKMFEPEPTYPLLAELGAKWARVQTGWCRCEPAKGKYDFTWLDAIVDRLLPWESNPGLIWATATSCTPRKLPISSPWAGRRSGTTRPAGVASFRPGAAEHFRDRVTHWEIWNEPTTATSGNPTRQTLPSTSSSCR